MAFLKVNLDLLNPIEEAKKYWHVCSWGSLVYKIIKYSLNPILIIPYVAVTSLIHIMQIFQLSGLLLYSVTQKIPLLNIITFLIDIVFEVIFGKIAGILLIPWAILRFPDIFRGKPRILASCNLQVEEDTEKLSESDEDKTLEA